MATRGRIGMVLDDGKVASIYQHWDSYPSCLGDTLLNNYKDKEKVEKLIALGDCSSVREEVDIPEGRIHTFDNPIHNVTIAYGRDRGETMGIESRLDESETDFWKSDIEEYGYLFKDGTWYVATSHGSYKDDDYTEIKPEDRKVVELTEEVMEKEDEVLT